MKSKHENLLILDDRQLLKTVSAMCKLEFAELMSNKVLTKRIAAAIRANRKFADSLMK